MKHRIDPTIDCVFKAILGAKKNRNLLIHFLNAVLEPSSEKKIKTVEILNPYNEKEFSNDKLSIVDIKAKDGSGTTYQVEIQIVSQSWLKKRILYNWSKIYTGQLSEGENYQKLEPVVAIWIFSGSIFGESKEFYHNFRIFDAEHSMYFDELFFLHTFELEKALIHEVHNEKERWTRFFKEGKNLDENNLPGFMQTPEMRQVMKTLKTFSEQDRNYDLYQRRMDYLMQQRTIEAEMDVLKKENQKAIANEQKAMANEQKAMANEQKAESEKQKAESEKQKAESEKQKAIDMAKKYMKALKNAGIDPEKL